MWKEMKSRLKTGANLRQLILALALVGLVGTAAALNYGMNRRQEADTGLLTASADSFTPAASEMGQRYITTGMGQEASAIPVSIPVARGAEVPAVTAAATPASGVGYFEKFRVERETLRQEEQRQLDEIIADERTQADTRAKAQEQKLALISCMERELVIEGLVRAKGFSDAVVTCQPGSVNIVVRTESGSLSAAEAAQLQDIAQRESGETAANIKLLPIAP